MTTMNINMARDERECLMPLAMTMKAVGSVSLALSGFVLALPVLTKKAKVETREETYLMMRVLFISLSCLIGNRIYI